jgi:hypothetical protein
LDAAVILAAYNIEQVIRTRAIYTHYMMIFVDKPDTQMLA